MATVSALVAAQAHPNFDADDFLYLQSIGWTVDDIVARWNTESGPCRWNTAGAKAKLASVLHAALPMVQFAAHDRVEVKVALVGWRPATVKVASVNYVTVVFDDGTTETVATKWVVPLASSL